MWCVTIKNNCYDNIYSQLKTSTWNLMTWKLFEATFQPRLQFCVIFSSLFENSPFVCWNREQFSCREVQGWWKRSGPKSFRRWLCRWTRQATRSESNTKALSVSSNKNSINKWMEKYTKLLNQKQTKISRSLHTKWRDIFKQMSGSTMNSQGDVPQN